MLGLLAAWNAPGAQAAGTGSAPSLGEVTGQYRSVDREDAVATVALWTQREVEAGTQGLLEAVGAAKAAEATLPAAAALLSDAALHAIDRGDPRRARWELQAAARLAHATRSLPAVDSFRRRFYLVALG